MQNLITKIIWLMICITSSLVVYSQTTTIDYLASGLSTTACNVFNPAVTINGVSHSSYAGGVIFNTTNGIYLATKPQNNPQNGTAYVINYNFIPGNKYDIKITALGDPTLLLKTSVIPDFSAFPTNGNTLCPADANVGSYGTVGYGQSSNPTAATSAVYTVPQFTITGSTVYPYLIIWASGGRTNRALDGLSISKVVITKTPPISFTLSPTSVSKTCGTALTQTFTATGTNIPQGATVSYLWNLGSASNNWLYNSAAAPQTITTTANTLSLTAAACGLAPGNNITVTATVNGTNYNAGTVMVSSPAFSINGPSVICSGGTPPNYSIASLGCSPTVSWSASPLNIVNIATPNSPTTDVSYGNSGTVTLNANYTSACGNGTLTKSISVGNSMPTGTSSISSNCNSNFFNYLNTSLSKICSAGSSIGFNYNITDPNYTNFVWTAVSVPSGASWYGNGGSLSMSVTTPTSPGSNSETIALSATGPCGTYNVNFTSSAVYAGGGFTVAPNPSRDYVIVSRDNQTLSKGGSQNLIYVIKITDRFGTVRKSFEYKPGITSIRISFPELSSGLYLISVFDGKKWMSKPLIIQK